MNAILYDRKNNILKGKRGIKGKKEEKKEEKQNHKKTKKKINTHIFSSS